MGLLHRVRRARPRHERLQLSYVARWGIGRHKEDQRVGRALWWGARGESWRVCGELRGPWFHFQMRWKPEAESCRECEFDWNITPRAAITLVASSSERIATLFEGAEQAMRRPAPAVWSPSAYLWHLVDVLRIGSDRLLTTSLDPAMGIPCWDENALAEVRQYHRLSPRVGVLAYETAVSAWVAVANRVPIEASVEHPEFGTLTGEDIIRRNAHEVQHHELDMRRGLRGSSR